MDLTKEFKINNYITLKLEDNKTVIYLGNDRFLQCKKLLMDIPLENIDSYDHIGSIDEAINLYNNSLGIQQKYNEQDNKNLNPELPPKVEFWGHCSNLQTWAEYNYDSRLLHKNLAFPLLKRLASMGDIKAKKVFKVEIATRICEGNKRVFNYLVDEGYLDYLSFEEILSTLLEEDGVFISILDKLIKKEMRNDICDYEFEHLKVVTGPKSCKKNKNKKKHMDLLSKEYDNIRDSFTFIIKNRKVEDIDLSGYFDTFQFEEFPETITNLIYLERINLSGNKIKNIPYSIKNLKNLRKINLSNNYLKEFPKSLTNLENLQYLDLAHNSITNIPDEIKELKNLEFIDLRNNKINTLTTDSFSELKKLKILRLTNNPILNIIELKKRKLSFKLEVQN